MESLSTQFVSLLLLGIPVACVSWTITHEEIFREPRDWCARRSESATQLYKRKFFYILTCEYCFSHYAAALFIAITGYTLLFQGWRGYLIAWLSLVWIANTYMSLFGRLRLDIKHEHIEIAAKEADASQEKTQRTRPSKAVSAATGSR